MSAAFAPYLVPQSVALNWQASHKDDLFNQAAHFLASWEPMRHIAPALILRALQDREQLSSTALGCGVAIPHGRIKKLKNPLLLLVRLQNGLIDPAANDAQAVTLYFFMMVPQHATQAHLDLLSDLARMLSHADTRHTLQTENDAQKMLQILHAWE